MGRRIIKQPNGKYAVWSTVVDNFVLLNANREEIIESAVSKERGLIAEKVDRIIKGLESGKGSFYQENMPWEAALNIALNCYGEDDETLQRAKEIKGIEYGKVKTE